MGSHKRRCSTGSKPNPLILPPDTLAEMEEQMLRQWLDESIPALGGLKPTPERVPRLRPLGGACWPT